MATTTKPKSDSTNQPTLPGAAAAAVAPAAAAAAPTSATPAAAAPPASTAMVPAAAAAVAPVAAQETGVVLPKTVFDELNDEEMEFIQQNTGLEDVDAEEYRLPYLAFNVAREITRPDGTKFMSRKDQFINILTDEVVDELEVIMLHRHKTNSWSVFSNQDGKNIRYCTSNDRIVGIMRQDHPVQKTLTQSLERKCEKCPQKDWKEELNQETGLKNRKLACATVHNVMFKNQVSGLSGILRFQKTSEQVFVQALNKYFLNQWRVKDKRTGGYKLIDYPLYSFVVKIRLELDTKSKSTQFARPVFIMVRPTTKVEMLEAARQKKYLTDLLDRTVKAADAQADAVDNDADEGASSPAEGFDESKMGKPATAAAQANPNEF